MHTPALSIFQGGCKKDMKKAVGRKMPCEFQYTEHYYLALL